MKTHKWIFAAAGTVAVATLVTAAIVITNKTYRTTAALSGVQQGEDATTHLPQYDYVGLAGHDLVNLAMGRPIADTNVPNQVLALTIACDHSGASLVVYDKTTDSNVATIASTTSFDSVLQQGSTLLAGPDRARFVAQFDVGTTGNATDGILDGFLTVAGRVVLEPATGCPKPVLIALDRDKLDKAFCDADVSKKVDGEDVKIIQRAGLGHLIGVLDLVSGGSTNKVLLPFGRISIRRDLPIAP
jgi:hypothetical protein